LTSVVLAEDLCKHAGDDSQRHPLRAAARLSVALAVALVLPGFVIADLAESRRATRAARSDLELVLRALAYALILQAAVAATGWTAHLAHDLRGKNAWEHHLGELAAFGLVMGVVVPTIVGLLLSSWLRRAEQTGELRVWHYALGAITARRRTTCSAAARVRISSSP
jgi:hypothetical protein